MRKRLVKKRKDKKIVIYLLRAARQIPENKKYKADSSHIFSTSFNTLKYDPAAQGVTDLLQIGVTYLLGIVFSFHVSKYHKAPGLWRLQLNKKELTGLSLWTPCYALRFISKWSLTIHLPEAGIPNSRTTNQPITIINISARMLVCYSAPPGFSPDILPPGSIARWDQSG